MKTDNYDNIPMPGDNPSTLPTINGELVHITWHVDGDDFPIYMKAVVDVIQTGEILNETGWSEIPSPDAVEEVAQGLGNIMHQWILENKDSD